MNSAPERCHVPLPKVPVPPEREETAQKNRACRFVEKKEAGRTGGAYLTRRQGNPAGKSLCKEVLDR